MASSGTGNARESSGEGDAGCIGSWSESEGEQVLGVTERESEEASMVAQEQSRRTTVAATRALMERLLAGAGTAQQPERRVECLVWWRHGADVIGGWPCG